MRVDPRHILAVLFPSMLLFRGSVAFISPPMLQHASRSLQLARTGSWVARDRFAEVRFLRTGLESRKFREFHVSMIGRDKVSRKTESNADTGAEISNRAKFRQTPIDPKVLTQIAQSRVCSPMGKAMRYANRSPLGQEMREKEKSFKGFARPPLYIDIPPPIMDMIGDKKKDKLTFIAGAMNMEAMPPAGLPEVAFCGRSNVGKSSIINAVTLSTTARSSDKPGMTQEFNFYVLPRRLMVVDMPGYGFAFANPHKMETWKLLFERYMQSRKSLKRVFVVIDARHGFKENDKAFMDQLERTRTLFQVVFTKCDLVHADDLARRHTITMEALQGYGKGMKKILMVSAYTGAGLNELVADMYQLSNKEQKKKVLPQQVLAAPSAEERDEPRRGAPTATRAGRGRGGAGETTGERGGSGRERGAPGRSRGRGAMPGRGEGAQAEREGGRSAGRGGGGQAGGWGRRQGGGKGGGGGRGGRGGGRGRRS